MADLFDGVRVLITGGTGSLGQSLARGFRRSRGERPGRTARRHLTMRVMTIVGTRPELIRLSLVFRRFAESGIDNVLVHTGHNYDRRLSDIFFSELELPVPDHYLGISRLSEWESAYAQDRHVADRVVTYLLDGLSPTATPRRAQPAGA